MTIATKILFGILTITIWACGNSATQKDVLVTKKKSDRNYTSNLISFNGKYQIDTNAILNNNNLESLIDEAEKADLIEKKSVEEIPVFIRSFLDSLTDGFSIASPGEDWQSGCCVIMGKRTQKMVYDKKTGKTLIEVTFDSSQSLPSRQLIYAGIGKDIALMTYYTGGWGVSGHILIIKFDETKIVDFWCGNILSDVTNKAEILKCLKDENSKLNPSYIRL